MPIETREPENAARLKTLYADLGLDLQHKLDGSE